MNCSKNDNILINVLTRTSNRPIGFRKCYTSIKEQTYKNIRHIVSFDNKEDLSYLEDLDIDLVDVSEVKKNESFEEEVLNDSSYAPYNFYCNVLLSQVEDGWILFLDDDDNLYHNKVIEELVSEIKKVNNSDDSIFVWQMRYPDGKVLPNDQQMVKQTIKKYHIGSPCFLFHSTHKNRAQWDVYKASDFRFLERLLKYIPHKVFLKKVMVQINNYGDLGQRNDLLKPIEPTFKMPRIFYKNKLWLFIPKYHIRLFGKLIFHKSSYKRLIENLFSNK